MSYTFTATGLPPGLALVGAQILGTPSTPGNYAVTLTVSDGVSSVSEVVSVTIATVPAPLPFWQLILAAASGCYASESALIRLTLTAETGTYWQDTAAIQPAIALEAGSYWQAEAAAAEAESGAYAFDLATTRPVIRVASGSYWRDRAFAVPVITLETGSYWHDRASAATAEAGSYWRDQSVGTPSVRADAGSFWRDLTSTTIDAFMPYNVITTTTTAVPLLKNNGYVLDLATTTASVNLLLPLTSDLTPGDRIEFYPYQGKATIKNNPDDAGFAYKGVRVSAIPLDNEGILIGLVYSGTPLGWLPQFKYDLTYTPYSVPPSTVPYTVVQSSAFGPPGTYATLTDGNSTTGATTDYTGNVQFIFPFAVTVTGFKLAGGNVNGFGNTAPNGLALQYSLDGSTNWTTAVITTGVSNDGTLAEFAFSAITAQYWRSIQPNGYAWFSEHYFLP